MNDLQDLKTIQCPLDGVGFWRLCVSYTREQVRNPRNQEGDNVNPPGVSDEMIFDINIMGQALAYYFHYRWKDGGCGAFATINTRQLLETLAHVYSMHIRTRAFDGHYSDGALTWLCDISKSPEVWGMVCEDLAGCGANTEGSVTERMLVKKVEAVWTYLHNNLQYPPAPPSLMSIRKVVYVIETIGTDKYFREPKYEY